MLYLQTMYFSHDIVPLKQMPGDLMARVEKGDASTYPQGIPTQQSCILNIFLLLVYHRDIQYTNTISKSVKIIIFCSQKYNLCTPVHIMSSNIKTLFSFFHRYQTHVDYELFEIFECELVEIFCILYRLLFADIFKVKFAEIL